MNTDIWNATIINMLEGHNIKCRPIENTSGMLAISRDDCHASEICKNLHEWEIIDFVLELIREAVNYDYFTYISWSGKTDDEWFLEIDMRKLCLVW